MLESGVTGVEYSPLWSQIQPEYIEMKPCTLPSSRSQTYTFKEKKALGLVAVCLREESCYEDAVETKTHIEHIRSGKRNERSWGVMEEEHEVGKKR